MSKNQRTAPQTPTAAEQAAAEQAAAEQAAAEQAAAEQAAAEQAAAEQAAAEQAAAEQAAAEQGLVKMIRDPEYWPAPHSADVHPDEVDNYASGGWVVQTEE